MKRRRAKKLGKVQRYELVGRKKSGEVIYVSVCAEIITIEGEKYLISTIRDITERKQYEMALQESEENAHALINNTDEAILLLQPDGMTISVNEATASRLGLRIEDIIGKSIYGFLPPEVGEKRKRAIEQVFQSGERVHLIDEREGRILETFYNPVLNDTGEVTRIAIYGRDITEKLENERKITESEEKYRNVVEQAHDGIVIVQGSRVVFSNNAFTQISGYTAEELAGLDFLVLVPGDRQEEIAQLIRRRLSGEEIPGTHEITLLRKDNSLCTVEATGVLITYHGAPADLIISRDISERKRLEFSLLEALQKLKILTGITRHDIINDMNVIEGSLNLALFTDLTPKQQEYLTNALQAGQSLKNTIEFTRDYEDFGSLSSRWVPLLPIVKAAASDIFLGKITLEIAISPEIEIFADPIIQKVFSTLLENSIRHGAGISAIRVSTQKQDDTLVIGYADDGGGIAEEDKERIFAHGYGKNTGIGLYLVRELLSITGISISETGKPGEGARFEIVVPQGIFRFQRY